MNLAPKTLVAILMALGMSACAPTVSNRGYFADPTRTEAIAVGVDTKQTISDRLGTPTLRSSFDPNTWYYVSQVQQQVVWYEPWTSKQSIIEVKFDDEDRVASVARLDETAMHKVHPITKTTPTKGRVLSFWEQMFGNVGRLPTGGGDEGPGQ